MQRGCELLDNKPQAVEFRQLLRRTGKGKDTVDHPPNLHDDLANSCAASCVLTKKYEWPLGKILVEANTRFETRTEEQDLETYAKAWLVGEHHKTIDHGTEAQIEFEAMLKEIEAETREERKKSQIIITRGWS